MFTASDIRKLLIGRDLPVPPGDHDPLNLDSLSLAWLVHSIDAELGVQVELSGDDDGSFESVSSIVDYVNDSAG